MDMEISISIIHEMGSLAHDTMNLESVKKKHGKT